MADEAESASDTVTSRLRLVVIAIPLNVVAVRENDGS
jgi:hypothetical protein